jgi:TPR repeat protein
MIVTRDVISEWRQQKEAIEARIKAEQEQREREARERAEREAQQAREAAESDRLSRKAAAEALHQQEQSAYECDRLAANPTDSRRKGDGVPFDLLKQQADRAFDACTKAVATFPAELRFQYQLGRAAQFKDKKQAFEIFSRLVQANYAAAFDNLGGMYLYDRKDSATAITLFKRGSALDDADSMLSLVDLIDKGLVPTTNAEQMKITLLHRAAELGHAGAQRGYELEMQKANQERINQVNQQQMMQLFGTFIQGIPRR